MNGALANSLIPLPFQLLCGYLLFALTFMPCFYGSIKKNFFLKNTVEYITCEALKPDKMSQTFSQRVDRYAVLNCFVCSNESKTLFFFTSVTFGHVWLILRWVRSYQISGSKNDIYKQVRFNRNGMQGLRIVKIVSAPPLFPLPYTIHARVITHCLPSNGE